MTFICCVPLSGLLHTMGLVHGVSNASRQRPSLAELLSPQAHSEEDPDGKRRELSPSCYTFLFKGWAEHSPGLRHPPLAVKAFWVLCCWEMATATWLWLLQCSDSHRGTGSCPNQNYGPFSMVGKNGIKGNVWHNLGKKSKLSHLLTQQMTQLSLSKSGKTAGEFGQQMREEWLGDSNESCLATSSVCDSLFFDLHNNNCSPATSVTNLICCLNGS